MQGCPAILQSDNGREFVNQVITEIMSMWPAAKLVHGRPRHPQSQGSVERGNQDIENMLAKYMRENGPNWPKALPFIQHYKNNRFHSGVGAVPYTLLYGQSCRMGLSSYGRNFFG